MGASEYMEWHEYLGRVGWSAERSMRVEYLLATLLAMTANINRDAEKRPQPFEVYDFAPWLRPDGHSTPDQSDQAEAAMIAGKNAFKAMLAARKNA